MLGKIPVKLEKESGSGTIENNSHLASQKKNVDVDIFVFDHFGFVASEVDEKTFFLSHRGPSGPAAHRTPANHYMSSAAAAAATAASSATIYPPCVGCKAKTQHHCTNCNAGICNRCAHPRFPEPVAPRFCPDCCGSTACSSGPGGWYGGRRAGERAGGRSGALHCRRGRAV